MVASLILGTNYFMIFELIDQLGEQLFVISDGFAIYFISTVDCLSNLIVLTSYRVCFFDE